MPGTSRVVLLHLARGGVLLLAPALAMPFPRVLHVSARRMFHEGLRLALSDAGAMRRLREERTQLLSLPPEAGRGAPVRDDALIDELVGAAEARRLTVIFGRAEPTTGDKPPGTPLAETFPGLGAGTGVGGGPDPLGELPGGTTPLPRAYAARLRWSTARSALHMTPDVRLRLARFVAPPDLDATAALLELWSSHHVDGVGFVVDAPLFASAVWSAGMPALRAFDELKTFFDLTRRPDGWAALDDAAARFARAAAVFGPTGLRQLLRRVGSSSGGESSKPDAIAKAASAMGSAIASAAVGAGSR